jgi:hypothetical protein
MISTKFITKKVKMWAMVSILVFVLISMLVLGSTYSHGNTIAGQPSVTWVSHTEYWNDTGEVSTIVRLTDFKGQPFSIDSCSVSIVGPDAAVILTDGAMSESAIAGNWIRTDPHPTVPGTYQQEVVCEYNSGKEISTSQSFHVGEGLSEIKIVSSRSERIENNLRNVNVSLTGSITDGTGEIKTELTVVAASLDSALSVLRNNLSSQFDALGLDAYETVLADFSLNVSGQLDGHTEVIITSLVGINKSVRQMLDGVQDEVLATINSRFEALNVSFERLVIRVTDIMESSLVSLNYSSNFLDVEEDLVRLKQFCTSEETQESDLCVKLVAVEGTVNSLKEDQDIYYNTLSQNTLSIYDLLSVTIVESIDSILATLNVIESQTADINETLYEWREEEEGRIQISIIS